MRQLTLALLILVIILSGCTPGTGAAPTLPVAPTNPPAAEPTLDIDALLATPTPRAPKATATTAPTQLPEATAVTASPTIQTQPLDTGDDTVYITDTGKKFHRDGCRHLEESQHPISRADAKSRGYEPCGTCKP